jgi:uncharacterized Zn finger protein
MFGWWRDYKPSRPREAKGGIKAQSKVGSFGESWWAKRWIAVLESFNIGARLDRGRSYARRGQVVSIDVDKGSVKAKVQGSRPRPYDVIIKVRVLSKVEWKKLAAVLSKEAFFAAKLLAGEMPRNIGEVFQAAHLSLFPEKTKDLQTECSCPDWSNPCKHISAVYYLLGEEFDRDPFLVFKMRGINREELLVLIGNKTPAKQKSRQGKSSPKPEGKPAQLPEPLPADAVRFWGEGQKEKDFLGEVRVPEAAGALVKRLGKFPFWRGKEKFLEAMERVYESASPLGMDVFLGEQLSRREK